MPNGWRLSIFDLKTGKAAYELVPLGDDDESTPTCLDCTPLVRRFVVHEVIFHLTNLQIEDFARPYLWNIFNNTFMPVPAYDYFFTYPD
jgi:hypothetical protein